MQFAATDADHAKRLDVFVIENISDLSRAFAAKLIEQGNVMLNGQPAKPGQKMRPDDVVTVNFDFEELQRIPSIELPLVYEDDDCLVINKPIAVLTHSKGAFNPEATVATWLLSKVKNLDGERAGIVHRLDRATSGVMICAKNPLALSWLQKQFSQRKVKKTYMAIVAGKLRQAEAVIDMPIERNPKAPATFRVGSNGKSAITHYKVVKTSEHYSLLELKPETGRTHQLRVHLKQLGHPIVGDTMYDGKPAERLFLHAKTLEITLPSRERKTFTTPVPSAFETFMKHDV